MTSAFAATLAQGATVANGNFLHDAFSIHVHSLGPFGPDPHFAVALSGGADSLALTLLAHAWLTIHNGRLTALTVDHGLRSESRAEAEQVARWMHALGIDHRILTPALGAVSNNLQEAARTRRYDALSEWCGAHGVLHCLLAHHAEDQAETVAQHLARGDTADGPSGMAAVRNYRGIRFLRPLLTTPKASLRDFLRARNHAWIEDPSNQNRDFTRVRIRQAMTVSDRDRWLAVAHRAAQSRAARDDRLAETACRLVRFHLPTHAEFARAAWKELAPPVASQLLADLLTTLSGQATRPRRASTERLCHALFSVSGQEARKFRRHLHHCAVSIEEGIVRVTRTSPRDAGAAASHMHEAACRFIPVKPLAAAPFWWLK